MKKLFALCLLVSAAFVNAAVNGDIVLPGEKWIAKFDKYVCAAFTPAVARPHLFNQLNVQFEQITTDSTLDNALLKATFVEAGVPCRYNAILLADNTAQDVRVVSSIAYNPAGKTETCEQGKAALDEALSHNDYLYYGHPHNLAIMMPVAGAEEVCNGNSLIGVNFVVSGRINPTPQ